MDFAEKKQSLIKMMEGLAENDICLAFSGGVDSSLLLKLACGGAQRTGRKVYAVTFSTRLHPACDMENAKKVAEELGGTHIVISVDELEQEAIRNNPPERCYLCKHHLFSQMKQFAAEKGVTVCIDGTNGDDLKVYRPGIRALKELGIISPLADCGFTKEDVRRLSAEYGISSAGRPSTPCMATRLPYGAEIDYGLLDRIAAGEEFLKGFVDGNVRLRVHGMTARIEIDKNQFESFLKSGEEIVTGLKKLGFCYITLDMEGFRSGSMDIGL